ncbi:MULTISPECIES: nuclease-related domain-containing protein [unclassified Spiroplasma]|uniref:nuclease-related domain-containing protein n=1 Tax=unclassified Spiroplasma TaxID=2637901 RepID=UPI0030D377F5
MSKNKKKNENISIVVFISLIIIITIIFLIKSLFKGLEKWIVNNVWITIIIIFSIIIVSILTTIILTNKYLKYKKNYFNLEKSKEIEYSYQIIELENRIKNYEKIYPNLKNFEHPYQYNDNLNNTLGIKGELIVKEKIISMFNEEDLQLFNNLYLQSIEGKINQIDHLLILNSCIFIIETKNWSLKTYGDYFKKNWIQYHGERQEFIPSPLYQNRSHVRTILYLLKKENINLKQFKFFSLVVFVQNNLQITENSNLKINEKALNLFELSEYIKNKIEENSGKCTSSSNSQRNIMNQIILNNNNPENIQIHKEQLDY